MRRVFVLSPLAPIPYDTPANPDGTPLFPKAALRFSFENNVAFAEACMRNCLARGEAPFAPHLLYPRPGVLDDTIPQDRETGIACGLSWLAVSDAVVAYVDRGVSRGMWQELARAVEAYQGVVNAGGIEYLESLFREGYWGVGAQGVLSLQRITEFRRLDGGPPPSYQWLHDNNVPHLRDTAKTGCPLCFGPQE